MKFEIRVDNHNITHIYSSTVFLKHVLLIANGTWLYTYKLRIFLVVPNTMYSDFVDGLSFKRR